MDEYNLQMKWIDLFSMFQRNSHSLGHLSLLICTQMAMQNPQLLSYQYLSRHHEGASYHLELS